MRSIHSATVAAAIVLVSGSALADPLTTRSKEGAGSYLADAKGMTLYLFKKDSANKSACSGECLAKWPVFFDAKLTPPPGVDAKDLGTITRDDGAKQSTFRGMPLYYFAKDKQAGDTLGQGVKEVWYVVDPAAKP